jgi:tetratricopeptide (TPR) repeat protein
MGETSRIQSVYAAKNNVELEARYDDWAREYDSELGSDLAWALARGDFAAAAEALAQAAGLRPDDRQLADRLAGARARAGAVAMREGRFGEAEQQYRALAAARAGDAYGHYWLGMARLRRGDCGAVAALARAVALRPNWGEAHIARARAEALCGGAEAARERAAALLRLADNADTRLTLALAELALGRTEEARRLAEPVSSEDAASIMDAARAGLGRLPPLAFATSSAWWIPPELRAP